MANIDDTVKARLRALRTAAGLSLAEAAERANMDPSTLSRLERGQRRLSLDHLVPLAHALGTTVEVLVAPEPQADPRVRRRPRTVNDMEVIPLSGRSAPANVPKAFRLKIPVRHGEPDQRSHEGWEWLYVLSGRLRLVLGDDDHVLEPGEAAEFSTWTPHWLTGVEEPAEILTLMGPHGERVHLRHSSE